MDVQEKKVFDAYFKEKYPELYKDVFDEDGDDRAIIGYSFAWSAWRAAKAQAVPEWISTSDRMPKEGEEVLVHNLGQVRQVTRDSKWAGGFKERNCYGWQAAYGQSHWMPKNIELPEEYHFYYKNDAKQKAMLEAQEPTND